MEKNKYNTNISKRIPMWLPYVSEIVSKKESVQIFYKGGLVERPYKKIHSIMFYGAHPPLTQTFLERCVKNDIPIIIHRRNSKQAIWITGSITQRNTDYLTKQILFRENKKKRRHIAKKLLDAKFKSMEWLVPYPSSFRRKIMTVSEMRILEAHHARRYWDKYYKNLGFINSTRREKGNELTSALDAVSKFVSGIILRWIVYHKFSPAHGYLHEPTNYPSLVYDLIEPYRGYIEKEIYKTVTSMKKEKHSLKNLTAHAILSVENLMDTKIYTNATRQIVSFQELLHGSLIALRAYLDGTSQKYIVPIPGKPNGGRPRKTGYTLYGRSAGPTDFWTEAKKLGMIYEKRRIKKQKNT